MAKRGPVFRKGEGGTFLISVRKWGVHFSFRQKNGSTLLVFVFLTIFLLMERFELQKSGPTVHLLVSILEGIFSQELPPLVLL